jgi:phosphohistidine phosphatase
MKKLYLARHAKSDWKNDLRSDMDRPLKGSGVRDAYSTAEYLRGQGDVPELIVSSAATRALHTALIFARSMGYPLAKVNINEDIYHANTKGLFEIVRSFSNKVSSAMLFGHNPTITDFVNKCINHRIDNVPTTGIACLSFQADAWTDIDKKAELVFFDYPKRRK